MFDTFIDLSLLTEKIEVAFQVPTCIRNSDLAAARFDSVAEIYVSLSPAPG